MNRLTRYLTSSIGAKYVMAVTGLLLALFLVGHLSGNLLVYKGRAAMNDYAEFLQSLGAGLWVIRAGLLLVFALHVWSGIRLALGNRSARPSMPSAPTSPRRSACDTMTSRPTGW